MLINFRVIGNSIGLMVDGVGFATIGMRWVFWMDRKTGKVSCGDKFYCPKGWDVVETSV